MLKFVILKKYMSKLKKKMYEKKSRICAMCTYLKKIYIKEKKLWKWLYIKIYIYIFNVIYGKIGYKCIRNIKKNEKKNDFW